VAEPAAEGPVSWPGFWACISLPLSAKALFEVVAGPANSVECGRVGHSVMEIEMAPVVLGDRGGSVHV
jgi:hypothetical protein